MNTKPIEVIISELEQKLADDINNSGLPPVITRYIVRDLLDRVQAVATQDVMGAQKAITQQLMDAPPIDGAAEPMEKKGQLLQSKQFNIHLPVPGECKEKTED